MNTVRLQDYDDDDHGRATKIVPSSRDNASLSRQTFRNGGDRKCELEETSNTLWRTSKQGQL